MVTLNFGRLPYAIYVENNATLTLNDTFLTGIAYGSAYLNNTLDSQYGRYPTPGLALFPSISTEPGANVRPSTLMSCPLLRALRFRTPRITCQRHLCPPGCSCQPAVRR